MVDYKALIEKYCNGNVELQHILLTHSRQVADRALSILHLHPEWVDRGEVDPVFVEEAAMLHDIREKLPIPLEDYTPKTLEEKLICYADKFYSKTHLGEDKPMAKIRLHLWKYGSDTVSRFDEMQQLFEPYNSNRPLDRLKTDLG